MYEIVFLYPGVGAWPPAYPLLNEKHSHLAGFITWESIPIAKCNEKYSHSHLVHDPCNVSMCHSVNANTNHYHLDSGDITHIPKSSEDFAVRYHYAYSLSLEVLQRCNTLLHFITQINGHVTSYVQYSLH